MIDVAFHLRDIEGPHAGRPVYAAGEPLVQARAALVLVHGRGAGAADMLGLAHELEQPGLACLAPDAAGSTWYPQRFMAPLAANEPWLSSALAALGATLVEVATAGIPTEHTFLLGFSQGACLVLEYAARHRQRYGAVIGFSGALIGPDGLPGRVGAPDDGDLAGTPILLGCSDQDPHIPQYRVEEAGAELRRLGGNLTLRIYPGLGHTINHDELRLARELLAAAWQHPESMHKE